MNVRLLVAMTSLLSLAGAPAWSAVTIMGDSKAAECSRAALWGRADEKSLATCDLALQQDPMDQLRRAATCAVTSLCA